MSKFKYVCYNNYINRGHGVNIVEELKDLNKSKNVSKLVGKEVSKNLRNFTLAIKKACHCEDERSEDVAIAKSLNINEITTQSTIARNDNNREGIQNPLSSPLEGEGKCARKSRKVAFTLAEVLITLGIIGVVAVLTLPSIITNYQKKVTVERLKKTYSTLWQAVQMSVVDNDEVETWNFQLPINEFMDKYIVLCTKKKC